MIWYLDFPVCKNTVQIARMCSDFQAVHLKGFEKKLRYSKEVV